MNETVKPLADRMDEACPSRQWCRPIAASTYSCSWPVHALADEVREYLTLLHDCNAAEKRIAALERENEGLLKKLEPYRWTDLA